MDLYKLLLRLPADKSIAAPTTADSEPDDCGDRPDVKVVEKVFGQARRDRRHRATSAATTSIRRDPPETQLRHAASTPRDLCRAFARPALKPFDDDNYYNVRSSGVERS